MCACRPHALHSGYEHRRQWRVLGTKTADSAAVCRLVRHRVQLLIGYIRAEVASFIAALHFASNEDIEEENPPLQRMRTLLRSRRNFGTWIGPHQRTLFALVAAKHQEQLKKKQVVDGCEHMVPTAKQWNAIARQLLRATNGDCMRTGPSCSNKWNILYAEFKKVKDYHDGASMNSLY